jgi:hypothetical protein
LPALIGAIALVVVVTMGWTIVSKQLESSTPAATSPSASTNATATTHPAVVVSPNPSPTAQLVINLPPRLAEVEFPSETVTYPHYWPDELHYPEEEFLPVALTYGALKEGATGWGAKLRYKGNPTGAADALAAFFAGKGWQVVERTPSQSGSYIMLVQKTGMRGSGVIVIEPDQTDSAFTRILVTAFP